MRLICPNCGAQYEVGADVIPDDGRDVQCSNCGQTWFENPAHPSVDAEADDIAAAAPAQRAGMTVDDMFAPPDMPVMPADSPAQRRTTLDPSIADILREEAAREEAARRSDTANILEDQPDLGLTDPPPPPRKADPVDVGRSRVARLQGLAQAPVAVTTSGSRKDLFPDIEEINSTLRSSVDRDDPRFPPVADARDARRSSWRGFSSMLALIVGLGLIYGFADTIAANVPALANPLTVYVTAVDSGRLWLDAQVQGLLGDTANG